MPERAGFREVLAVKEFRALWIAHAQSRAGDQLARVAVAVLVFDQTTSALLTALTYALTFLPPAPHRTAAVRARRSLPTPFAAGRRRLVPGTAGRVDGGSRAADRGARGAADRYGLAATVVQRAARNAMLPNVLSGDRYVVGMGIATTTDSIVQVAGFAFGGLLVGSIGSHAALGVNAATFALSVAIVWFGVREHRPAPDPTGSGSNAGWAVVRGAALVFQDARLRSLAGLAWLYGFYIAPEGIAAPYAEQLQAGTIAVGLLMAAEPIGSGIGAYVLTRWVEPDTRKRLIGPLAVLAGVPLVLSALVPALPVTVVLWTLSGVLSSHVMLAIAEFTQSVPTTSAARRSGWRRPDSPSHKGSASCWQAGWPICCGLPSRSRCAAPRARCARSGVAWAWRRAAVRPDPSSR